MPETMARSIPLWDAEASGGRRRRGGVEEGGGSSGGALHAVMNPTGTEQPSGGSLLINRPGQN